MFPDLAKAGADDRIGGVELQGALVGVDSVRHLIVARLVERSEVEPDFSEVRVNANGAGVSVESVVELIDVVVEYSDRAPEGRVLAIPIDCLLIGLVGLAKVAGGHVGATEEVPRERIVGVWMTEVSKGKLRAKHSVPYPTRDSW